MVRRRVARTEPAAGYGLVKLKATGRKRRLSKFDPALLTKKHKVVT